LCLRLGILLNEGCGKLYTWPPKLPTIVGHSTGYSCQEYLGSTWVGGGRCESALSSVLMPFKVLMFYGLEYDFNLHKYILISFKDSIALTYKISLALFNQRNNRQFRKFK
jgi:hypothetical protein